MKEAFHSVISVLSATVLPLILLLTLTMKQDAFSMTVETSLAEGQQIVSTHLHILLGLSTISTSAKAMAGYRLLATAKQVSL